MALAPSAPIPLFVRSRLVNALLKSQTNGQNQTELSQYATDQHKTNSSVKLKSRRMHLRLWKRGGDGLGAASPNLVETEIEAGQRPVELEIEAQQDSICGVQAQTLKVSFFFPFFDATERLDVAVLLCCGHNSCCAVSEVVLEQVD